MKRRTFLAGLGTTAAGGSALLASGAYSQVGSQRNVTIETVGDDDAYLRLVYSDWTVDCDGEIDLVTLTNQLKHPLTDIEVAYDASGDRIEFGEPTVPGTLGTGEARTVTLPVECTPGSSETETVRFRVTVRGSDSVVQAWDREIDVVCSCSSGPEEFDATGISFIAFCRSGGQPAQVTDIEVTHVKNNTERIDEPTGVRWSTDEPVEEVVLFGGREWYLSRYPGVTSGVVRMSGSDADEAIVSDPPGSPFPVDFGDGNGPRRPDRPCGCRASTKVEAVNGWFDILDSETTGDTC